MPVRYSYNGLDSHGSVLYFFLPNSASKKIFTLILTDLHVKVEFCS